MIFELNISYNEHRGRYLFWPTGGRGQALIYAPNPKRHLFDWEWPLKPLIKTIISSYVINHRLLDPWIR